MDKTLTVYKDHTDDILATWTGDENLLPSFRAACAVRFKDFPHIRYEVTNVSFKEQLISMKPKKIVITQAIAMLVICVALIAIVIVAAKFLP